MFKKLIITSAKFAARILPANLKLKLYGIDPAAGVIRRLLNAAVPDGISEVSISGGELAGAKMLLNLQTEKDYWLGTYEIDLQAAVRKLVRPGMTVFDIGANIGFVSLLMEKFSGKDGRVYAFEALPENLVRLEENIELNELNKRIFIQPYAVVDSGKEVEFLIGPSNGMGKVDGSAGRDDIKYQRSITVEGISIDEFIYNQGYPLPQLLKMDIEGGEVLALSGMKRLLQEENPIILLEIHGQEAIQFTWDFLTGHGYNIYLMKSDLEQVTSPQCLDWKSYIVAMID